MDVLDDVGGLHVFGREDGEGASLAGDNACGKPGRTRDTRPPAGCDWQSAGH